MTSSSVRTAIPTASRVRILTRLFGVESVRARGRYKLRTGLTALGSMVGVAAVIWVVAIGRAGTAIAENEMTKLGDNLVWVEAGSRNINGVRTGTHGATSLMPKMLTLSGERSLTSKQSLKMSMEAPKLSPAIRTGTLAGVECRPSIST